MPPTPLRANAPGLFRRLAAVLYDTFLLVGLWWLAAAIALTLNGGQVTPRLMQLTLFPGLFAVTLGFFVFFWMRSGQTLGMKAWRLKAVAEDGTLLAFRPALIRCLAAVLSWACLGMGFFWVLLDRERRSWHERLSGSATLRLDRAQAE